MNMKFSFLPVLVGVSLAGGAALGVLYLLLRKDDDDDNYGPRRRLPGVSTTRPVVKTIPIPKESVGVVIGKNGSNIREIQEQTQTKIKMREDVQTDNMRMCTITGSAENTEYAESLIKSLIRNQPLITTTDIRVPQSACGRIIGRQGESIRAISSASGAKIDIENTSGNASNFSDRRITLKGTADQIAMAKSMIADKVQEDAGLRQRYEAGAKNRTPRRDVKAPQYLTNSAQKEAEEAAISKHSERLASTSSDNMLEVYVSAVETPGCFWVQVMGPSAVELDQLHEQMTDYYSKDENKELHVIHDLEVGQYVAAPFLRDNKWYRAKVISIDNNEYAPEESRVDLYYVDYGDSQESPRNLVFELSPDFLKLQFQAIECSLAKVKPNGPAWTEEATDLFEDLTYTAKWKALMCSVDRYEQRPDREGSPVPIITLFDIHQAKDINIAEELVKNQFAVYLSPSKGSKPGMSGNKTSTKVTPRAENGSGDVSPAPSARVPVTSPPRTGAGKSTP